MGQLKGNVREKKKMRRLYKPEESPDPECGEAKHKNSRISLPNPPFLEIGLVEAVGRVEPRKMTVVINSLEIKNVKSLPDVKVLKL